MSSGPILYYYTPYQELEHKKEYLEQWAAQRRSQYLLMKKH